MSEARMAMIHQRLTEHFAPLALEIKDESHLHAGHASAGGAGHFAIHIVSAAFSGHNAVQRHRMVYQAVDDIMGSEIHALSIQALTPEEAQSN